MKKYLPFARYLGTQLQLEGIEGAKVAVAKGIPQMAVLLREGKVDLFMDSPFPSVAVSHLSGSKFLLSRWKSGEQRYHGWILTRKDSGIHRLEDLEGKIVAFNDSYSTTSYFLPKLALMEKGFRMVEKREGSDSVEPGEVGYIFSGADENTMVWMLRGKVSAGAIDNRAYLGDASGKRDHLKAIYRTPSVPRQIVSYRADLSPDLVSRIKEILISMDQSEEGRKVLHDFGRTTKFDELSGELTSFVLRFVNYMVPYSDRDETKTSR